MKTTYGKVRTPFGSTQVSSGKAGTLRILAQVKGLRVPAFVVIEPGMCPEQDDDLLNFLTAGRLYAVRSSAKGEDAKSQSFAGQFDSFLNVGSEDVFASIEKVRLSADKDSVRMYCSGSVGDDGWGLDSAYGTLAETSMSVIVQEMVDASVSGVIFGVDPMGGDDLVISCVAGLGDELMRGALDGETIRVGKGGTYQSTLLSTSQIDTLLTALTKIEKKLGPGQDVEFAFDKSGKLFILQARAITKARFTTFDASNIQESYPGKTSPLTFSFARRAYESVYLSFARFMGVRESVIEAQSDLFDSMLGYHDSKIYYNLNNWYRLLSLLPFYRLNSKFMEGMMGLSEPIDSNQAPTGIADLVDSFRSIILIGKQVMTIDKNVSRFTDRVDKILANCPEPALLSLSELRKLYVRLEAELLELFGTPVVNDFFAMIAYGLVKALGDKKAVHQYLFVDDDVISARPPALIAAIHALIAHDQTLLAAMASGRGLDLLQAHPEAYKLYQQYLAQFGDRSLGELKLESPSLKDNPELLLKTIASVRTLRSTVKREPVQGSLLLKLAAHVARQRLSDRENLRFYRTRVFALVRRLFKEMGVRLANKGTLSSADDVFYLSVDEVLGQSAFSRQEIQSRKERFAQSPEKSPLRIVFAGSRRLSDLRGVQSGAPDTQTASLKHNLASGASALASLSGTAASAGVVRGRARVILNPQEDILSPGDILVAERTDPGWIMHFALAAGVVTAYGSVLSHSAIVARELGLPCVVAVKQAMTIGTGDLIEVDGKAGTVKVLERAYIACAS